MYKLITYYNKGTEGCPFWVIHGHIEAGRTDNLGIFNYEDAAQREAFRHGLPVMRGPDDAEAIQSVLAQLRKPPLPGEQWLPIDTLTLNEGEVLLYADGWIHDDFNPKGIREGFRNETDDGPIWCTMWNDCHEVWETVRNAAPTHWRPYPKGPQTKGEK
jgi:hypothetical protein